MGSVCYMCPRWNDWEGRCDAPYWCPDKEAVNERWQKRRMEAIEEQDAREG